LTARVKNLKDAQLDPNVAVVVAPSGPFLALVRNVLRPDIGVGAQNVFDKPDGAFTGETSASQLCDLSVEWVILGHSERRALGESDAIVASKTKFAIDSGLKVIWCCGESLDERNDDRTVEIVAAQLDALKQAAFTKWDSIVLAYEPIWAIGTGRVATPQQAQEVHEAMRQWLNKEVSKEVADETRIIYGGSVNVKNCGQLAEQADIDGFLVGGASLTPSFVDIINCKQ